jgi:6-phosphogluconolactonase
VIRTFSSPDELSRAAAEAFVAHAQESILQRGRFVVALSGGSTPRRMYELLVDEYMEKVDWQKVHVYWSDDRYVHPSHPDSNEGLARTHLLSRVPIPNLNVHGMFIEGGPKHAAEAYDRLLHHVEIDLCLLGLGADAHTASLFPGDPSVHETQRLAVASRAPVGVTDRLTMTPPCINSSRMVLFLVAGKDKARAVEAVLRGDEDWHQAPAQAIARHAPQVAWFMDNMAAQVL